MKASHKKGTALSFLRKGGCLLLFIRYVYAVGCERYLSQAGNILFSRLSWR